MEGQVRKRLTAGIILRSVALNAAFYISYPAVMLGGFFFLFLPRRRAAAALRWWSRVFVGMCRVLGGMRMEVRGAEHIPHGAAIVAGKHQSMWETFALFHLLDDAAIVLKRELYYIPLVGQFLRKFRMIQVERTAGAKALIRAARAAAEEGRQILIFPEGHRMAPFAAPDYKPGVAALYGALRLPCVPFALNSGLFWPRRSFWRWPGTVVVEFLPAIAPGLPRGEFMERLEGAVEPAARALAEEGLEDLRRRGLV